MTRTPRSVAVLAVIALASVALAACGDDDDASDGGGSSQATSVTLGTVPGVVSVPAYVADQEGIFEKNGLEVKVAPVPNAQTALPGLGRQFDFILAIPFDFVQAAAAGIDAVGVVGLADDVKGNPATELIAGKDTGITHLEDLGGKSIGVPSINSSADVSIKAMLDRNGVDPESVEFVEVPFETQIDQLNAGRIDAVFSAQPLSGLLLSQGHVSLGSPFQSVGDPPITAGFIAAERGFVEDNPDTVKRFRAAIEDAVASIERDDAVARRIMEEELQLPREAAQQIPLLEWNLELTAESIGDWIRTIEEYGELRNEVPDPETLVVEP